MQQNSNTPRNRLGRQPGEEEPLRPFWTIVQENLGILAFVFALGTGGLIADLVAGFGPTWPSRNDIATRSVVPISTSVVLIAVLMNVFQAARNPRISIDALERRRARAFYCLLVTLAFYLVLFVFFTFVDPGDGRRAKGLWKRLDLQQALEAPPNADKDDITPNFNPSSSDEELLEAARYKADRIWRQWTVNLVELLLVLTWLVFFGSVTECFGMFQLLQRRQTHPKWLNE